MNRGASACTLGLDRHPASPAGALRVEASVCRRRRLQSHNLAHPSESNVLPHGIAMTMLPPRPESSP